MYNIDLYTYTDKPFTQTKKFTIHPLDEPGKEKYYSDQSHCRHYLKRTDPFVFKSIIGMDYETLKNQQKEDIERLHTLQSPIATEPKNLKTISNTLNQDTVQRGMHVTNFPSEEQNKTCDDNYPNINKRYINTEISPSIKNKKLFKSHSSFRPYIKPKDFKAIYGYENASRFKTKAEKFNHIISMLKKANNNKRKNYKMKRSYDGFTCFDPPCITKKRGNSGAFEYLNNKMQQTLNCFNGTNTKKAMNEEELRQNLFNQTSAAFLKKYHLPDLMKIADSRQIIKRQRIGLSKEMGERYNPYSLIAPSKNRTGRNYVGDLFKH